MLARWDLGSTPIHVIAEENNQQDDLEVGATETRGTGSQEQWKRKPTTRPP